MRRLLAIAVTLVLSGPALAASPTTAQKDEFYRVCMGIAQNQTLCACKAEAAMTLIDERFMDVVIASMKGGTPASTDFVAYNTYVAKSNQVCKPDY